MTDRKTLMIAAAFIAVTLAAAIGRIVLPPDLTLFPGATAHSYKAFALFSAPVWLIVFTVLLLARGWLSRNPADEIRPWQSQGRLLLIVCGGLVTVMQFFMIARSLGMALADPLIIVRAGFALIGALMVVTGNQLPKLPWLRHRVKMLELEPAQGAKLLRFNGWMTVGCGACLVVFAYALPPPRIVPAVCLLLLCVMTLTILRRVQLKREQRR